MISILQEISKWKEMAIDGLLSNKSLMKLTKAGIRKPVNDYLSGVGRGTENILNKARTFNRQEIYDPKTGFKIFKQPQLKKVYTYDKEHPNIINSQMSSDPGQIKVSYPKKFKNDIPITKRHEADEAIEKQKMIRKFGKNNILDDSPTFVSKKDPETILGAHQNPLVLKKEGFLSKQLSGIYPHLKNSKDIKLLSNVRKETGEDVYYNLSNKKINKQISNVNRTMRLGVDNVNKKLENNSEYMNLKNKEKRYRSVRDELNDSLNKENISNELKDNIKKTIDNNQINLRNSVLKTQNKREELYPTKYYI